MLMRGVDADADRKGGEIWVATFSRLVFLSGAWLLRQRCGSSICNTSRLRVDCEGFGATRRLNTILSED